jgi:hypothetical protein
MPKVFISSTIHDLFDIRSALRYMLEELGFEVLTSEAADFPHSLEGEAWKAALAPIDLADYYVLIIGRRAGWITPDGISVTRAELRRARELQRSTGKPRLVLSARAEVLTAFRQPSSRPLPESDNWQAVRDLIKEAGAPSHDRDTTWIHPFTSFHDLATALRTALRVTGPLRRRVQESNLGEELHSNAQALLVRVRDAVVPLSGALDGMPRNANGLNRNDLGTLTFCRFVLPGHDRLSVVALQDAISSGEFLEYDAATGAMKAGPVQRLLIQLRQRTARYETLLAILESPPYARQFAALTPIGGSEPPNAEYIELMWSLHDEVDNIERLTRAIFRYVSGRDSEINDIRMNPPTPDPIEAQRMEADIATRDEVDRWLLGV